MCGNQSIPLQNNNNNNSELLGEENIVGQWQNGRMTDVSLSTLNVLPK
jgi:hypothetical protein